MSTSYSVFVKTDASEEAVKASLEGILNCKLTSYEHPHRHRIRHQAEMLGVCITLGECDWLEDDGVIAFSEYQFRIAIEFRGQARLDFEFKDSWREAMTVALSNMLPKQLECECMAVEDLQRILRTFPESG